jgi:tRNA(Ile)-lysidine synthase
MAARELRYSWFEELVNEHGYKGYATAHHKDDVVETFFINLLRGSGIKGLSGMKPRLGNKLRPLLFAGRGEIESYRQENHILFREDSSNQDIKYLRNSIRIQILPLFRKLNPAFSENMLQTMDILKSVEAIYLDYINKAYENCIETREKGTFRISLEQLSAEDHAEACLFAFLQPYQFNAEVTRDIYQSLKSSPGKVFMSPSHRLLLDRKYLIVEPLRDHKDTSVQYYIDKNTKVIEEPLTLDIKTKDHKHMKIDPSPLIAHIDYSKVKFPLIIRNWKEGDFFYPLGMDGKKKISDFLIDLKIPVFDKERIWLLCSEDEVVWVIGLRLDDRYKISPGTGKVLRIEVRY